MNSTSPSSSLVRIAARSPARSSAGPDVTCRPTPISLATMPAERGLAEPGRTGEQQVVGGLAPAAGGLEDDRQVLLEFGLADELVERARPQAGLVAISSRVDALGAEQLVAHDRGSPATASGLSASPQQHRRRRPRRAGRGSASRDLVGAVAETRRARRGHRRAPSDRWPCARRRHRRRPGRPSIGRSSRDFSSTSRRAAVFLPTPGTRHSAATSSSASTRRSASGWCTDRIARASAGPTPWAPSNASNESRSSRVAKPYSVAASSRTWWWIQTNTSRRGRRAGRGDRRRPCTRYPTPPTSTSTSPVDRPVEQRPRNDPIIASPPRMPGGDPAGASGLGEVAQRERRGVGGVGRLRRRGEPSSVCTIRWTWSLSAAPSPGDRQLHLVRRVLGDLTPGGDGLGHGQPARLADPHGGAHVDLEEHPLDRHHVGPQLGRSARSSACSSASRCGSGVDGSVRITPTATARASGPGRPPSTAP